MKEENSPLITPARSDLSEELSFTERGEWRCRGALPAFELFIQPSERTAKTIKAEEKTEREREREMTFEEPRSLRAVED